MNSTDTKTTDNVTLLDAPPVLGLTFRHFRGDEDYPSMLAVNNGSKVADNLGHDLHTLDTLRYVYGSTHNHDPQRDVLIADVGGRMVAYNRVYWTRELDGLRTYWHFGFVLPEWRGKGLGAAMIRWAEGHARELEATHPEDGPTYLGTSTNAAMHGLENLLKEGGYMPVRYGFHMETPDLDHIPEAPMPEGLEVRPAKPEHYRAIWDASTEAFKDEWGATETTNKDFEMWLTDVTNDPKLWMVAWDGDQVAGSILNLINQAYNESTGRKVGFTESISVRRPWRKRGLASALIARSMKMFKEMGMTQTALGVDTENPSGALRVYERMGYRTASQSTIYRRALESRN